MPKGEDITTKFKVDISDLKKGITEANNQIKLANAQFKAASSGMNDWTKSSEGIRAKLSQLQSVLNSQVTKLSNYEKELQRTEQASQENGRRADELKAKLQQLASNGVSRTSEEYKKYEKALNDVEKEQLANERAANNLRVTILNQQAAVGNTEREFNNLSDTLTEVERAERIAAVTGRDIEDVLDDVHNASNEASDGFTVMKGALANLVADGFRKAIDAAKEFASNMITTAAEVKAENSQFEQTFGDMGDSAEAAIKRVASSTGILETRLKTTGAQIYAFARSNGATIPEAMSLMETALTASADSAAYYDKSLEESSETMMSFLKGNYANDAALGVSATEFTRNAKATELFGKKYNDLSEIQKQQTLLKMVTDSQELSGAAGQAAREMDGWENVQGNLNESWRQFQALVGTPFLEAIIPVIQNVTESFREWQEGVDWEAFNQKISDIADKIMTGFGWIIDNKDTIIAGITGIIAAFVAAKITECVLAISKMVKAIQAAAAAQGLWNAIMATNPVGAIALAVGLLVAGIVLLIQHWDQVKEVASACWEAIKSAWSTAGEWFSTNVIEPIKGFFSGMWEGITGFFSSAWEGIKTVWNTVSEWFNTNVIQPTTNFFSAIGTAISGFFTAAWNGIVAVWTTVANWFSTNVIEPVKTFFQPLVDWFTKLFTSISDTIKSIWEVIKVLASGTVESIKIIWGIVSDWFNENVTTPVKEFFTKLWDAIKTAAQTAWNFIKGVWTVVSEWFNTNIIQPVKKFFTDLWNAIKEAATTAWNGIKSVWNTVSNWFSTTIIDPVKKAFTGLWDKVKSTAKDAWEGVKSTFSNVSDWFKEKFSDAWEKVKKVFSTGGKIFDGIKDGILNGLKTVVNGIIRGINKVVKIPFDGLNKALDKIRGINLAGATPFSGLPSISVPQIPELATGIAKAKKGHQYLLEGKHDEAVLPLHKNAQWLKAMAGSMLDQMKMNNNLGANTLNTGGSIGGNSNVNNFTQIINAPKAPSRIELYRQTKNLLALKGGV